MKVFYCETVIFRGFIIVAWPNIREEQNRRIAIIDFYALSVVTPTDAMTSYRGPLRDLPASIADPVAWIESWYAHSRGDDGALDPWPAKP